MISATEAKQATIKVNEEAKEQFRLIIESKIPKMIEEAIKNGLFTISFLDRHVGVPTHHGKMFFIQLQKFLSGELGYSVGASSPRSPNESWTYSVSWDKCDRHA